MAKKAKVQSGTTEPEAQTAALARYMSQKATFERAVLWIVGTTPLIVHSWSEKAKREMLEKQIGATKPGKEKRDPQNEFTNSLYVMKQEDGSEAYGFPATALKKAMLSAAHKDKGIPRDTVMRSVWLVAPFVRTRSALGDAICDLPLVRLWGSKPEMREDMVRVGVGLNKTSSLAYRAQFKHWAIRVVVRYNSSVLTQDVIASLIYDAGISCGIGDWRNEKNGMFGSFHLATDEETKAWEKFRKSGGMVPRWDEEDANEFLEAAE